MRRLENFLKGAIRFYAGNIGGLFRELFPHYVFSQNWELRDQEEMEEVLHVYKCWMGVELSHKEYVLKCNSLPLEEQEELFMGRVRLLRRMYKELPEEYQREVAR